MGGMNPELQELMILHSRHELRNNHAVCEIYSPARVEPVARKQGFAQGHSLDLTTTDDAGRPWDFDDPACRKRAKELVKASRPLLLIGSSMCTYFSTMSFF